MDNLYPSPELKGHPDSPIISWFYYTLTYCNNNVSLEEAISLITFEHNTWSSPQWTQVPETFTWDQTWGYSIPTAYTTSNTQGSGTSETVVISFSG